MFNQICINEEILPTYIYIYIYILKQLDKQIDQQTEKIQRGRQTFIEID